MATLLVVDDDPTIVSLSSRVLQTAGHFVVAAIGGSLGIAAFELHAPLIHAVLMDVHMPGVDGVTAFHYIRHACPEVPFVFVTASTDAVPDAVLTAPHVALLAKPFRACDLVSTVGRVLAAAPRATDAELAPRLLCPPASPAGATQPRR
ncbi:MAG: response regulator [Armatimonadetes bacterium]|nr:response regulator [Armatimonadota bacterium]